VDNAENLRQLASLLHELVSFARTSRTHLEICRSKSGALEIRRLADDGLEALPSQLKDRWVREAESHKEATPHGDTLSFEKSFGDGVSWDAGPDGPDRQRDSDAESLKDYTACSPEVCGYCGHCSY